jgi:hypothetical protein
MRIAFALLAASFCAACSTAETVQFVAKNDQRAVVRDGQPALVSERRNSIVLVRPASRQFQKGTRPVFVVGLYNRSPTPQEFRVADIGVTQRVKGNDADLKVVTYEQLVSEEQTRQAIRAFGAGLAVVGNSMSAASAGYYSANSTVYGPRGTYQVHTTGYSPTAAAIAHRTPARRTRHWSRQPSSAVRPTWPCLSRPSSRTTR